MKESKKAENIRFVILCAILVLIGVSLTLAVLNVGEKITVTLGSKISSLGLDLYNIMDKMEDKSYESEILSEYETTGYMNMDDEALQAMVDAGLLDGTYYVGPDGGLRFVRELLYERLVELAKGE